MCAIPSFNNDDRSGLELLNEVRGLVEVLGAALTGNMPLEGRIRDGFPVLLDTLAITLSKLEKTLTN